MALLSERSSKRRTVVLRRTTLKREIWWRKMRFISRQSTSIMLWILLSTCIRTVRSSGCPSSSVHQSYLCAQWVWSWTTQATISSNSSTKSTTEDVSFLITRFSRSNYCLQVRFWQQHYAQSALSFSTRPVLKARSSPWINQATKLSCMQKSKWHFGLKP